MTTPTPRQAETRHEWTSAPQLLLGLVSFVLLLMSSSPDMRWRELFFLAGAGAFIALLHSAAVRSR